MLSSKRHLALFVVALAACAAPAERSSDLGAVRSTSDPRAVDPVPIDLGGAPAGSSATASVPIGDPWNLGVAPDRGTTRQVDFNNTLMDPMNPFPDARYPHGYGHACAVSTVGTVQCWGNSSGVGPGTPQLGPNAPRAVPISNVRKVAAGDDFTCALRNDGTVACWGENDRRQLGAAGPGTETPRDVPEVVDGADIDAGSHHVCVVTHGGGVICWGDNHLGQLGLRGTEPAPGPQLVPEIVSAVHVATAAESTCVVLAEGGVECWGDNGFSQLGTGSMEPYQTGIPTRVPGLRDIARIGANGALICASTRVVYGPTDAYGHPTFHGGVVSCWGNGNDHIDHWPTAYYLTPDFGPNGPDVWFSATTPQTWYDPQGNTELGAIDLAVGNMHVCAIFADGPLGCWGYAQSGVLGDGLSGGGWLRAMLENVTSPEGRWFQNAAAVFTGRDNTCAVTKAPDSRLWCWGNPDFDMTANAYRTHQTNVSYYSGYQGYPIAKGEAYPEKAVDLGW